MADDQTRSCLCESARLTIGAVRSAAPVETIGFVPDGSEAAEDETVRCGPLTTVTVLAILPDLSDRVSLSRIFDHSNWELHLAGNSREAQAMLKDVQVSAVICESRLPDGCWKDVLGQTLAMADPPPVIVTDRLAASSLWAEVLSMGGYDLLMKPFDQTEVYRVVGLAWLYWRNQAGRADTLRKGVEPAQRSDTLTKRAGSAA